MLVVQRAHNEHLLLHFDGPVAFGLRLSRVFRQSLEGVFSEVRIGRDQNWYELLEDHSVRDVRPVAAKRMIHGSFGQYRSELFPDGLDDICLERGHGLAPLQGSFDKSPNDRAIRTRFTSGLPLLAQALRRTSENFCSTTFVNKGKGKGKRKAGVP